jgi:rubrerythrin
MILLRRTNMSKKMCSWKKDDIKENTKEFKKLIKNPSYYCKKCGRVAKDDKNLCKAKKL